MIDDPVKSLLHNFVPLHAVLSYKELPAYCAQNIAIRLFTKLSIVNSTPSADPGLGLPVFLDGLS